MFLDSPARYADDAASKNKFKNNNEKLLTSYILKRYNIDRIWRNKLIMDFTFTQAKKIAEIDYNIGVIDAIDELEKMGYDCSYYYDTMAEVDDPDEDDLNLKTRDELFTKLGIAELMSQAYDEVCNQN